MAGSLSTSPPDGQTAANSAARPPQFVASAMGHELPVHVPGHELFPRDCGECTACCTLMAVVELRKPGRFACDHVSRTGCSIHATRPASCREFFCGWIRGDVPTDPAWRPDRSGVMFDQFIVRSTGQQRLIAHEMWPGAASEPMIWAWMLQRAEQQLVEISHRDGTWQELSAD